MKRRLLQALAILVALLVGFAVFLWFRAGRDLAYMLRVLGHRDSSTDDYRWKDAMGVAASPAPVRWPARDGCAAVAAAFAQDPDATAMDAYLTDGGALALVVIQDGVLTCEWYGNGGAPDQPAAAFSISKTVVALLAARAVATGALALDEPITTRVPEPRPAIRASRRSRSPRSSTCARASRSTRTRASRGSIRTRRRSTTPAIWRRR